MSCFVLSKSAKVIFMIKKEGKNCYICNFVDDGFIIYQHIDASSPIEQAMEEIHTCLLDFQKTEHSGNCIISVTRKVSEANPAKKRKTDFTAPYQD